MRARESVHGHHGVADELLDGAAVALDGDPHLVVPPAHQLAQRLRIEPLAERSRVGQIAEEDADGLPRCRSGNHVTSVTPSVSGFQPGYPAGSMFDALTDKLQSALGDLRGRGVLDEEAISRAMREIRLALLEADVNFDVVKDFVAHVRERALGEDVRKSLTPGQQVVKIVHEELTELLGSSDSRLAFAQRPPTTILLAGLQGSGKTTAAGEARAPPARRRAGSRRSSPPTCSGRRRSTSSSSSASRSTSRSTPRSAPTRSGPSTTGSSGRRPTGATS